MTRAAQKNRGLAGLEPPSSATKGIRRLARSSGGAGRRAHDVLAGDDFIALFQSIHHFGENPVADAGPDLHRFGGHILGAIFPDGNINCPG